ncbi:MAG: FecR domain-containing protein, partial [Armatimonadetes bacterium]|nr:FecR domain-containing protein [Armatimonadota bacterium]
MRAQWRHCLLGAAVLLVAGPGRAQEYRTARVSDVRGGLVVRGVSEDEFSYVERNAVLREGDTLWTDDKGSAEAELEYGSWLRLAEETKVELRGLPPTGELHLWAGSLYLDLSPQMPDGFRVRTPAGDIDVRPESVVRVDLSRDEQVRISVVHGLARVRTDGRGTELVGAGERAYLLGGRVPDPPGLYNRQDRDSFDHYHYGRVDYYVRRPVPAELDRGLVGARDLYDNGSWVVVDNSRYWRPRCDPGWRPYSAGYWSYLPDCGYTWVDYAPWGYLTSHYGRWLYRPTYGWLWSPGYTWGPSYVAWSSFGGYCGWAPLDPWNQPCYYGNFGGFVPGGGFGLSFGLGNVFVDFRSWTFCDYNRFYFGRHHRQYWNNGPVFVTANQIHLDPNGFRFGNDALSQIGVPRERFRGLVAINGEEAKRRALRFDQ